MTDSDIGIRAITDIKGCFSFQAVVRQVWEAKEIDILPAHALITIAKNGGIILGAYAPEGPPESDGMVGIALGWPGLMQGRDGRPVLKHCSHQVGVMPSWRGKGIGFRLKLAQREAVIAQGATDMATWTYDPLQRVNAAFNIHKLGATSNTYMRDVYGELDDALNAGMPTDRLQVDWSLRGARVKAALAPKRQYRTWNLDEMEVLHSRPTGGVHRPDPAYLRLDGAPLAVPIPDSVVALRERDMRVLLEWRLFLRSVLEQAFAAGYVLMDCIEIPHKGWCYIMTLEK